MAGILAIVLVIVIACSWVGNLLKLIDCDFQAPLKCEAVHGIGLIPVIAPFTVFVDSGS